MPANLMLVLDGVWTLFIIDWQQLTKATEAGGPGSALEKVCFFGT